MAISYQSIGQECVSVNLSGTIPEGVPCTLVSASLVKKSAANDNFCGVLLTKRGSVGSVQVRGFVTVGFSGENMRVGYVNLAADGAGKVQVNENGRSYLVIDMDTTKQTITFLL